MKPFRFWVQTALPLVYDDSLSYYELLCKVINYINNFMKDMTTFEGEISEYSAKVEEIEAYVNGYFSSTDFQQLVDAELDKMAEDGKFDEIIQPILEGMAEDVNAALEEVERITDGFEGRIEQLESDSGTMSDDIDTLDGRIDDVDDRIDDIEENIATAEEEWGLVFVGGISEGDCFYLFREYDKTNHKCEAILFDAGDQPTATNLLSSLALHNVDKMLAIVISHWHYDHIIGLGPLLASASISFEDCVMYKPHYNLNYSRMTAGTTLPSGWLDAIQGYDSTYTGSIIAVGGSAVYAEEGQEVSFGDLKLVFSNLSASKFDYYYNVMVDQNLYPTDHTDYNNFSMATSVYYGGVKLAFAADFMPAAEAQNRELPSGADLYKVEHHGLNVKTDNKFANAICAKCSVVSDYGESHARAIELKFPTISRCIGVGALYDAGDGEVEFVVNKGGVYCKDDSKAINSDMYHGHLASGLTLYDGVDFDDLLTPGVYTIYNGSRLAQMQHAPDAESGGKLIVDAVTSSGYVNQYFIRSNSQVPRVYLRCRRWISAHDDVPAHYEWGNWRTLVSSFFKVMDITANHTRNLTLRAQSSYYENRVIIQNGVMTISMAGTTTTDLTSGSQIAVFPELAGIEPGFFTNFVGYDETADKAIPIYINGDTTENYLEVQVGEAIANDHTINMCLTLCIHTDYPL